MKTPPTTIQPTAKVSPNGSVVLRQGRRLVGFIAPEVFTEGWAKNALNARFKVPGFDGIVVTPSGERIGLLSSVKTVKSGYRFRFTLLPLETLKAIHIRLVVNLPYQDWHGSSYRSGLKKGVLPIPPPKQNRLAQTTSPLNLGPSKTLKGLGLTLTAPKLLTVLQDNRQWTPYLHAFVTGKEKSVSAWKWMVGQKKVYEFTLTFDRQ
jgi:hypothetical protein